MTAETQASLHGSCLCRAVCFRVEPPLKWVAHCHCTQCQRAHGAAFVTWVSVDERQWRLDDAQGALRWHESSSAARRGFCGRCGSSLFFRSTRWPGEVHVARANFSTPPAEQPRAHGFYETHVDWFAVHDDLPKKASDGRRL